MPRARPADGRAPRAACRGIFRRTGSALLSQLAFSVAICSVSALTLARCASRSALSAVVARLALGLQGVLALLALGLQRRRVASPGCRAPWRAWPWSLAQLAQLRELALVAILELGRELGLELVGDRLRQLVLDVLRRSRAGPGLAGAVHRISPAWRIRPASRRLSRAAPAHSRRARGPWKSAVASGPSGSATRPATWCRRDPRRGRIGSASWPWSGWPRAPPARHRCRSLRPACASPRAHRPASVCLHRAAGRAWHWPAANSAEASRRSPSCTSTCDLVAAGALVAVEAVPAIGQQELGLAVLERHHRREHRPSRDRFGVLADQIQIDRLARLQLDVERQRVERPCLRLWPSSLLEAGGLGGRSRAGDRAGPIGPRPGRGWDRGSRGALCSPWCARSNRHSALSASSRNSRPSRRSSAMDRASSRRLSSNAGSRRARAVAGFRKRPNPPSSLSLARAMKRIKRGPGGHQRGKRDTNRVTVSRAQVTFWTLSPGARSHLPPGSLLLARASPNRVGRVAGLVGNG